MVYLLIPAVAALLFVAFRLGRRSGRSKSRVIVAPRPGAGEQNQTTGSKKLAGQVAIVTGGGTGLGKAMSLELARQGAKVMIASRDIKHLQPVVDEIIALGGEAACFPLDIREPKLIEEMVAKTVEKFGAVNILINNAAGNFLYPAEKLSTNQWNSVRGIVLDGTFYCTKAVGRQMIKQGKGGSVLNITANYAESGQPGVVHSCAAKSAVLAMTRTLAVEWGRYSVRVNAFAPGPMVTDGASANLKYDTPKAQELIAKYVPAGRLTSAEEMAVLAVMMVSPEAVYINGAHLVADGGQGLARGFLDLADFDQFPDRA